MRVAFVDTLYSVALYNPRNQWGLWRDLRAFLNLQCPGEQNVRYVVQRKQPITVIDETLLRRITMNPEIFGGKPIIRGMRISVELILLADWPKLVPHDKLLSAKKRAASTPGAQDPAPRF